MRTAEYNMVQRAALVFLVVLLFGATLLLELMTGWGLWRYRRRAGGPKLFFIGWRRLGWIVLWALVVPVGLYIVWTRLAPWSVMRYGINYAFDRVALELLLTMLEALGTVYCRIPSSWLHAERLSRIDQPRITWPYFDLTCFITNCSGLYSD